MNSKEAASKHGKEFVIHPQHKADAFGLYTGYGSPKPYDTFVYPVATLEYDSDGHEFESVRYFEKL